MKLTLILILVPLSIYRASGQQLTATALYKTESIINRETQIGWPDLATNRHRNKFTEDIRISGKNHTSGFEEWEIAKYYPHKGTESFVNFYVGLNNYLYEGKLPSGNSPFNLRPLSSPYWGINLDNLTRIGGFLYLDWGVGLNIRDFGFENTRTRVVKKDNSITITEEANINGIKSRLTMSYLNLHFVPTISFGKKSHYTSRVFRMGFGVFAGYKLGSHVKYKYHDRNGSKQKIKIKDHWFINPFRYGVRATVGWNFFDLFFNYELSELFEEGIKAPRLNPVTFGIIL